MEATKMEPLLKWPHAGTLWQEAMATIWNAYCVSGEDRASGEFHDWAYEGGDPPMTQEEAGRLAPARTRQSERPPPNTNRRNSCSGY